MRSLSLRVQVKFRDTVKAGSQEAAQNPGDKARTAGTETAAKPKFSCPPVFPVLRTVTST